MIHLDESDAYSAWITLKEAGLESPSNGDVSAGEAPVVDQKSEFVLCVSNDSIAHLGLISNLTAKFTALLCSRLMPLFMFVFHHPLGCRMVLSAYGPPFCYCY